MRKNVVTFDNTPQTLFVKQPRQRANHETEERLPPLEDDRIRRETLDSLKGSGPGDRIKRIENRLGSSVERCGADIQLRLAGEK